VFSRSPLQRSEGEDNEGSHFFALNGLWEQIVVIMHLFNTLLGGDDNPRNPLESTTDPV
jgi:hypothetical protein